MERVYQLLGGKVHDQLRVYANGWYGAAATPAEFAKAAERPLRDGYQALKCYPLAVFDQGSLRHVTRRMLCRRFEELDIAWIEEPADPYDTEALERINGQVNIPIAVGERLYTRYGFLKTMELRVADILQPDAGNTGGIMETKKIAAMAEAFGMRVAPHNCGSAPSTAVAVQVGACMTNFLTQEIHPYFPERPGYVQVLENPPGARIANGRIAPPGRAGAGGDPGGGTPAPWTRLPGGSRLRSLLT